MPSISSGSPVARDVHSSDPEQERLGQGHEGDAQVFAQWGQGQVAAKEEGDEVPLKTLQLPNQTPTGALPRPSLPRLETRQHRPFDKASNQPSSPAPSSDSSESELSINQAKFDEAYPKHLDFHKDVVKEPWYFNPKFEDSYEKHRVYTGTTSSRLAQMRDTGADPTVKNPRIAENMKQNIAADPLGNHYLHEQLANLGGHNYAARASELGSGSGADPKVYADMTAMTDEFEGRPYEPALARSFWPSDALKVEHDPDVIRGNALRTPNHVVPGLILRSHEDAPQVTEASEIYRQSLNEYSSQFGAKHGISIDPLTAEEGAEMLHGRQTPSEYDFKMQSPRKIPLDPD